MSESFKNLLSDYDAAISASITKAELQVDSDYVSDMILDCLERIADDCWSLASGDWLRAELRGKTPKEIQIYWIEQYSKPGLIFDSPEQIIQFRERIACR